MTPLPLAVRRGTWFHVWMQKTGNSQAAPALPAGRFAGSGRVRYLVDRVLMDGTLPVNPACWLPVLLFGVPSLSASALAASVGGWARRRFRATGCEAAVRIVGAPPALLDAGGDGSRSGVALEVRAIDAPRVPCLHAWFAADGSRGTYAVFEEGATEIATLPLDAVTDDRSALRQLNHVAGEFIGGVLLSVFEDWLEGYSADWRWIEPPVSDAMATAHDAGEWHYALVSCSRDEIIIGFSARGNQSTAEVAVFFADSQGALADHRHVGFAQSPAELRALLANNFGRSPGDTVIAGWMLGGAETAAFDR
jgi:hypothetical protein